MAEKGWTARVAAAAGAAAGIGAAQLGLGYGLGVVIWPAAGLPDDSVWLGSLGWATWIAASATVFGAVLGSRLGGPAATRLRGPWRFALAASAAVGALVTVALIALPARAAVRADTFSPQVIAGGYAVIGLALGLVVAYWAVVSRPVAANLIATAAWLWALAIAAVVVELTLHRSSATYLTSWQFAESGGDHRYGTIYWPSAVLTLGAALLIGVIAAVPAVRRGDLGAGAAASGAVGPLLVAAAFFVLAPQLTGALGPLESAYLIAPYAVISGLAGSALTVSLGQASANRRARRAEAATAAAGTAAAEDEVEPADRVAAKPPRRSRWRSKSAVAPVEKSDDPTTADLPPQPDADADTKPAAPRPSASRQTGPNPANQTASRPSPAGQPAPQPTPAAQPTPNTAAKPNLAGEPTATKRPSPTGKTAPPAKSTGTAKPASAAQPTNSPRATPSATTPPRATPSPVNRPPSAPQSATPPPSAPQPSTPPPSSPAASGPVPDDVVDAEIAAAARRGRGRAKKAEPAPPKAPSSTVTPPPTSPTVAQINPKPPAAG